MAESVLERPPPAQTDPPRSPAVTLSTRYDLPSEDPDEPGLPDEFQYYDARHVLWHKRPDWFAVLGVDRLYQ